MRPVTLAGALAIGCLIRSHLTDSAVYSVLFYFMGGLAILAAIICWAIEREQQP